MSLQEAHAAAKRDRRADADADASAFAAATGRAMVKPALPLDLLPLPATFSSMMPVPAIERVGGNGNTHKRKRRRGAEGAESAAAAGGGAADGDRDGDDVGEESAGEEEEEEDASPRKLTADESRGRRIGLVSFLRGGRDALSDALAEFDKRHPSATQLTLKTMCVDRGIAQRGTVAELKCRIIEHDARSAAAMDEVDAEEAAEKDEVDADADGVGGASTSAPSAPAASTTPS